MSTDKSGPSEHYSHRSLIRSTSIISAGTLSSRILGFIRDILLAKLLGTGFKADAFFVAFRIPNLLRDLVGEGAANAAVVPVLSEYVHTEDKRSVAQFISVIFVLVVMVLLVVTIIGIVLAPVIVHLIAPGFAAEMEKIRLTTTLTRILFPYLILVGLGAYAMAVLYTFKSFVAPAFGPCLLNLAIIGSAVLAIVTGLEAVYVLAFGVLVGGLLPVVMQMLVMKRLGIQFIKPTTFNHPGARRVGQLLIPRLVGSGVYELNVFVDTLCASLASIVGPGGVSAIYYANRLIQFPMGIFGLALASAALPTFSQLATQKDFIQFKATLRFSLETIIFLMLPITVMFMIFSMPLIKFLFERGEFDTYSTYITASALLFLSMGLVSFGGVKIMVTAFHATQDTKTPVKVASICLIVNVVLNFLLMVPMQVGGIALASAIASTLNFCMLFYLLHKRLGGLETGWISFLVRVILATVVSGTMTSLLWKFLPFPELRRLIVSASIGLALYATICYFLRITQAQKTLAWIQEKLFKTSPDESR